MSTTHNEGLRTERPIRSRLNETKPAAKTTELIVYVAAVLAVIITAVVVGRDGNSQADPFNAEQAIRYITFLSIGYMVARGLAKSGSRSSSNHDD